MSYNIICGRISEKGPLQAKISFSLRGKIPYSGKFPHGANFRIFRMKASVCEKKAKFMRMRRHVCT